MRNGLMMFLILLVCVISFSNAQQFGNQNPFINNNYEAQNSYNNGWSNENKRSECSSYEFRCSDGKCIQQNERCNGVQDCYDGSDESQCTYASSICSSNKVQCGNGQCIDAEKMCNGQIDCQDRSDESRDTCRGFKCSFFAFHCNYGACVDGLKRCDGKVDCADGSDEASCPGATQTTTTTPYYPEQTTKPPFVTPPTTPATKRPPTSNVGGNIGVNQGGKCYAPSQPTDGSWQLHYSLCNRAQNCNPDPRTQLYPAGTQIVYKCNRGFQISASPDVFCTISGEWSHSPTCQAVTCKPLNTDAISATCSVPGSNSRFSCDSPSAPGTVASLKCRSSYTRDTTEIRQSDRVTCQTNGRWQPEPIKCNPVCGFTNSQSVQGFIVNGTVAKIAEFPWHASLHITDDRVPGKYNFICGATIISSKIVLTAAHCVYNENIRSAENPSKFRVITGNTFRDYNYENHNAATVKKSEVSRIIVECSFTGLTGNYAGDIAIVELTVSFTFTGILAPACLDATSSLDEEILQRGNQGKVAGFGRTEKGETSFVLQTLTVPFVPKNFCKERNPDYARFVTLDKICAGYTNGSSVCDGDSGGGLVFPYNGVWYLEGIVSVGMGTKIDGGTTSCDSHTYSLYTKVSTYIKWIRNVLVQLDNNPVGQINACEVPIKKR